jgi:hypothetical protein
MTLRLAAVAVAASFAFAAHAADNPFEQFKGKVKPGLYEYKVDMDMSGSMPPGMPAGMGKQSHTMQHCVTEDDINRGQMGARERAGGGKPDNCKVEDMKVSGNTATYKMVCKGGPDMTAENKIAFREGGYAMDMVIDMQNAGGSKGSSGTPMHVKEHIESKYLGPCSNMK